MIVNLDGKYVCEQKLHAIDPNAISPNTGRAWCDKCEQRGYTFEVVKENNQSSGKLIIVDEVHPQ